MTEDSNLLVFYAAKSGDLDTVKEHFDQCDSLRDDLGNTPLHWSASAGHLDCVRFFAESDKIDVNAVNSNGDTALHKAVWKGHEDVVKYLVEDAECALEVRNKAGQTPGEIAQHLKIKAYLESFYGDDEEEDDDEEYDEDEED